MFSGFYMVTSLLPLLVSQFVKLLQYNLHILQILQILWNPRHPLSRGMKRLAVSCLFALTFELQFYTFAAAHSKVAFLSLTSLGKLVNGPLLSRTDNPLSVTQWQLCSQLLATFLTHLCWTEKWFPLLAVSDKITIVFLITPSVSTC